MQNKPEDRTKTIIATSPKERYVCYNDVVGRGSYKIVYRGYDKHNGIEVAWNSVRLIGLHETEISLIIKEVKMLSELSPQNEYIINFLNAWIDKEDGHLVIITELALSGTLKDYILKINEINMRVIKKWCCQILTGIGFLHKQHIAHRDLKCNNIFYNSNSGKIILGDFGLAKHKHTQHSFHTCMGTPEYMAPEMYDESYDEKIDIYAFGMCMLEMITKKIPYGDCGGIGSVFKKVIDGEKPSILSTVKNQKAKGIIEICLETDPKKRPTAEELLNNEFFNIITEDDNDEKLVEEKKEEPLLIDLKSPQSSNKSKIPISSIESSIESPISPIDSPMQIVSDNESEEFVIQPYEETEDVDQVKQLMDLNLKKLIESNANTKLPSVSETNAN